MKGLIKHDEIYRVPIVVYASDLEIEEAYFEYYNEEYWRKYKEKKYAKKKIQKKQRDFSKGYY